MSLSDVQAVEAAVRNEREALLAARASPRLREAIAGWTPDPANVDYVLQLLERNMERLLRAEDDDARVLALAGLNPPGPVLEDYGLLFDRFPELATAHAAVAAAVARLLAPFA